MPKVPHRKRQRHVKSHHSRGRVNTQAAVNVSNESLRNPDSGVLPADGESSRTPTPDRSCRPSSSLEVLIPNSDISEFGDSDGSSISGPFSPPVYNVSAPASVASPDVQWESDCSRSNLATPEPVEPSGSTAHKEAENPLKESCSHPEDSHLEVTDVDKTSLLLLVRERLQICLRENWMSIADANGLHVMYLSRKFEKAVQRRIYFSCCGDMQLSVHCKPVSPNMFLKNTLPPRSLSFENIGYFVERIVSAVEDLRRYEVCTGVSCEEYKGAWNNFSQGEIDRNPFQECRYGETIRSFQCCRLVDPRSWRCSECAKLLNPLRRRAEAIAKEVIHRNTPNAVLTEDQKNVKLKSKQKELEFTRRKLARLREKMQTLLTSEGVGVDDKLSQDLNNILQNSDLTPEQSLFFQQQWKASNSKKACGRRWHPTMIRFALSISMRSPSAYEAARDSGMIQLPSKRTLFDYTHVKPKAEGVDMDVIEEISNRVQLAPHKYQQYHILMCDEMYISQNLVYKKSTGKIVGYANLSDVKREMNALLAYLEGNDASKHAPPIATKVLTYLIKGVATSVKEAVASFAVNQLSKEQLYCWSWEVITYLEIAGVAVVAFVMDGSSINRSFIKMHTPVTETDSGVVFDTINKASPHRVLYFIADVPHLLKTIRNCFSRSTEKKYEKRNGKIYWKRCLQKNGQMILWKTIIRLYNEEKNKTLRKAFKLNVQNVFINSYTAMRVKLAAEVLSQTVAKLLKEKQWPGIEETIIFIEKVNDFFDMLNGAHSNQGNRKRNPNLDPYVSVDDEVELRFGKLLNFLDYLREWKEDAETACSITVMNSDVNESNIMDDPGSLCMFEGEEEEELDGNEISPASTRQLSSQTIEGIEIAVRGFIGAVKYLLSEGTQWINARVFCQDPIEQFFSKQRSKCGGSTNPNLGHFLNNQNSIHIQGQLGSKRGSTRGNTELMDERMEVTDNPLPKRKT